MLLSRFNIRPRLLGAFGIVLILVFVVAGVGLWGSARQNAATKRLETSRALTRAAMQVKFRSADFNGWQTAYALDAVLGTHNATSDSVGSRAAFLKSAAAFRTEVGAVPRDQLTPSSRRALDHIRSGFAEFMRLDAVVIGDYRSALPARHAEATKLVLGREIDIFNAIAQNVDELDSGIDRQAAAAKASATSARSTSLTILIVVTAIAILIAVLLALTITASLVRPLRRVEAAADGIARGELDQSIEVQGRDEVARTSVAFQQMIGYLREMAGHADRIAAGDLTVAVDARSELDVLGNSLATMAANLRGLLGNVSDAAGSLSASSQQMATTSEEAGRATSEIARAVSDVAQGAERQVRAIQAAQEMSTQVGDATRVSASNADETVDSAERARTVVREGADAVAKATNAMAAVREASTQAAEAIRDLGSKSDEIGGIVATISGIAEQTNLLALNAAIEAARAGEQGRGFAVVAEEVRKLAEESQAAAGSIATLIAQIQSETSRTISLVEDGTTRTHEGVATVEEAGAAFEQVGEAVDEMNRRVAEIAAAVQQIAASSERMGADMTEVAAVAEESSASSEQVSASTQQTSASVQQIAASAQELAQTAGSLDELVGRFTLA
jgi:methyl-accepting chemotaxis protein